MILVSLVVQAGHFDLVVQKAPDCPLVLVVQAVQEIPLDPEILVFPAVHLTHGLLNYLVGQAVPMILVALVVPGILVVLFQK